MRAMKRFGLTALFAIGVALFGGTPALAQSWTLTETTAVSDPDHGASGQATLTNVTLVRWYPDPLGGKFVYSDYTGYLTVTCQGLTPGAYYSTPLGQEKADRYGNLTDQGWVRFTITRLRYGYLVQDFWVNVYRLNAGGSQTLVLTGADPVAGPRPRGM
jgi:hypothetical protein